jgi:excisionase family DNA binding protein
MDKLLLSAEEAAEVLGIGRAMVYDLIRLHLVQSVKIGRRRLIPARALVEYVERIAPSDDISSSTAGYPELVGK